MEELPVIAEDDEVRRAHAHLRLYAAVAAYLCGCFNGALFTSRLFFHDDVRTHGSGNAGLTNFYRTFGGPLTFVRPR